MGDLNENQRTKGPILKYLGNKGNLINIATISGQDNQPTWQRGTSKSTIDYIWTTPSILSNLTDFGIHNTEEWFDTDHQALTTKIEVTEVTDKRLKTKRKQRKIYNMKQATDEAWKKWKESTQYTAQRTLEKGPQDHNLNRQWNTIRNITTKVANRYFGLKKVPREQTAYSRRECEKYKAEKTLARIIKEQDHQTTLDYIDKLGATHPVEANSLLTCEPSE